MNPEDEEEATNDQPVKQPKISKIGSDFMKAYETRKLGKTNRKPSFFHLEAFAEDELIRKEYKELKCDIPGTPRSTFLMVFSPDGTKVASTHGNHNIYVTDIRSGKSIRTLVGHPRTPWCIAFHPTSNQIVASGCLGGQVRIWDLSGGSEVWTAGKQSVIASIAFHPNDRILVIATYNEVYFWDWSKPEPFVHAATNHPREKVRYVAFDKLGHKLITGIANSPQTRWERVRAPVPVPRQAQRSASPYRRRITPRLIGNLGSPPNIVQANLNSYRAGLSDVTERERRISASYRNLVHEYEMLVHRYVRVYRPPTMIDRGTDPMEVSPSSAPAAASSSSTSSSSLRAPRPSIIRICTLHRSRQQAQTNDARTSTTPETPLDSSAEPSTSRNQSTEEPSGSIEENAPTHSSRRILVLPSPQNTEEQPSTSGLQNDKTSSLADDQDDEPPFKMRIKCSPKKKSASTTTKSASTQRLLPQEQANESTSSDNRNNTSEPANEVSLNTQELLAKIRSVRESLQNLSRDIRPLQNTDTTDRNFRELLSKDVCNRIMPIINSVPPQDRPHLLRLFRHKQQAFKLKRTYPTGTKKTNRRHVLGSSSDSSSSDEEEGPKRIHLASTSAVSSPLQSTTESQPSTSAAAASSSSSNSNQASSSNINIIFEHLVTNLLADTSPSNASTTSNTPGVTRSEPGPSTSTAGSRTTNRRFLEPESNENSANSQCARTSAPTRYWRLRNQESTRPTLSETITSSSGATASTSNSSFDTPGRRRYLSAFFSTRPQNVAREDVRRFSPIRSSFSAAGLSETFPPDEVVNYSERVSSGNDRDFTRFESSATPPPPIRPENIGIGNMYLNIVQDLESSLNDVRNIRASNRPGETSDMLSSFSERLENIMNQSDTILRNLRHSMDMLSTEEDNLSNSVSRETDRFDTFYVRDRSSEQSTYSADASHSEVVEYNEQNGPQYVNLLHGEGYNPLTSDHTYPRTAENSDSMTPLMTSLHLTISHIQRQASLLRRQVESIERIDRAMLEVAQVQVIRQLFVDIYQHLNNLCGNSGVSSVRHMMAGTRISDPQPYDDSQTEEPPPPIPHPPPPPPPPPAPPAENTNCEPEPGPSTSRSDPGRVRRARTRCARKTYPPSRFHRMHRLGRRVHLPNFFAKRSTPRDNRMLRVNPPHKLYSNRASAFRSTEVPLLSSRSFFVLGPDILLSMTRRLELLLMDQTRFIGLLENDEQSNTQSVSGDLENTVRSMLSRCRVRMNRILGLPQNSPVQGNETISVTSDGASRYGARSTLSVIIETLTRFFDQNTNLTLTASQQNQIQGVLGLSLLLSEILLLRIVDSIPPPTGMNLDPERERLTARIDQMCSQMLQRRLSGQNHQLTRSLRLMRLTVRHATRALNLTYTARRNAIIPARNDDRQELLDTIYRCLQNIQEQRTSAPETTSTGQNTTTAGGESPDWNSLIDIIARHTRNDSNNSPEQPTDNSTLNVETGEQIHRSEMPSSLNLQSSVTVSDDNEDTESDFMTNNNSESNSQERARPLYRTSNVNLLNNESSGSSSSSSQFRPWNVPTVQVNDVPITESNSMFHPRFWTRQRLSERLSELRSVSTGGLFRPRFLHPLYAGVNPFDADLDDPQREQIYDSDMITTVTPNHRIQVWDISSGVIPVISNPLKNVVVSDCKIHNDASVDIATDGTILVTLLPSGGYLNVTNKLGVYSLRWESLGQCLYITSFEQNAVSVSLSPLSRHLVVGLASRRVSIVPNDKWTMGRIFLLDETASTYGSLPVLRELEQNRDSRATSYKSVNCIRWLPVSGQGLVYATNTGQLILLT